MLAASACSAATSAWSDCITEKYAKYAQAQEKWQRGLSQLIAETAPRYAGVAQQYMTDQLRAIEQSLLAVEYLAQREPTRLKTNMTLNNWLDIDEGDRQRIASSNKRYAELLSLSKKAMKWPPHPDGDGLRHLMRTEISKLPAYRKLLEAFSQSVKDVESIECAKSR